MNEPRDLSQTADMPSVEADSLDAGLAAGFGRPRNGVSMPRGPKGVWERVEDAAGQAMSSRPNRHIGF